MTRFTWVPLTLLALLVFAGAPSTAAGDNFSGTASAQLRAFEEVPTVFSFGGGQFLATIHDDEVNAFINWQLSYANLSGQVVQAHIHFGAHGLNGGITVFLCSNLGNGPAGTQACPTPSGQVSGQILAEDVINGASAQGIGAGQLRRLLRSIRAGVAYVNVHSDLFPGGEIRGQIEFVSNE